MARRWQGRVAAGASPRQQTASRRARSPLGVTAGHRPIRPAHCFRAPRSPDTPKTVHETRHLRLVVGSLAARNHPATACPPDSCEYVRRISYLSNPPVRSHPATPDGTDRAVGGYAFRARMVTEWLANSLKFKQLRNTYGTDNVCSAFVFQADSARGDRRC